MNESVEFHHWYFHNQEYKCLRCGAIVGDTQTHEAWHEGLRDFIMSSAISPILTMMQTPLGKQEGES